ncbi:aspartate--tRNA ligase [Candidatus Pacearchaeota archaeon]|jgi:aspartyl-tRNA synthetase|nr:aspartate--tRNA ligase [Candidatus Pacearchaeota archaeon]|tara:strand:+ start:5385 stop:6791 length:1407 start_codon:yes stop_codon:yes gene_type:complete
MLRTHNIGEVNEKLVGKKVKLCGWVDSIREHGKVIFLDVRDRYSKIQAVIVKSNGDFGLAKGLTKESCVLVEGEVNARPKGTENKELSTGNVELFIGKLEVLSKSPALPFEINEGIENEELRLKYRFLDLRSERMHKNIMLRSDTLHAIRDFYHNEGFAEIETPILAKSTPEGARDYLVPSRNFKGKFYALPQSPQLFKQLSQVAGFDKYIQIARCFRDEDLRSDRQPEFTQIDVEMSFIEQDDIIEKTEKMLVEVFDKVLGVKVKTPFPRIGYDEAMKKYGSDAPDLRKDKGDKKEFAFCWVVDFPLFEKSDNRCKSTHHPFTMPVVGKNKLDFDSGSKSVAYDVVLNGVEIGGGSIRIHDSDIQEKVFDILKLSKNEVKDKFGFLLDALSFGAPPHGGIALGFDRLMQIMSGEESIREVIAYPKNKEARDVMLDAPSDVDNKQLKELGIEVLNSGKKKSGKKGKKK